MRIGPVCALWLLLLAFAQAQTAPWFSITWFPNNDTFRSWDEAGIFVLHPIPAGVCQTIHPKSWELALYRSANPQDKLRVPCPAPVVQEESGWALWDAAAFKDLPAALQPLGEGTFTCAILADGKPCSNLVKITIRHDYTPGTEPVIRAVFLDTPLAQIGIWIVPPTPADPLLTNYVAAFPDLEFDSTWITAPTYGTWDGAVGPLNPGQPYGITYWLRQYQPPSEKPDAAAPHLPAQLRARFVERADDLLYEGVAKDLPLQTYTSAPIAIAPIAIAPDPRDWQAFEEIFGLPKSPSTATAKN